MINVVYQILTDSERTLLQAMLMKIGETNFQFHKTTNDFDPSVITEGKILIVQPESENSIFYKRIGDLKPDITIDRPSVFAKTLESRRNAFALIENLKTEGSIRKVIAAEVPHLTPESLDKIFGYNKTIVTKVGNYNIRIIPDSDEKPKEGKYIRHTELLILTLIKMILPVSQYDLKE